MAHVSSLYQYVYFPINYRQKARDSIIDTGQSSSEESPCERCISMDLFTRAVVVPPTQYISTHVDGLNR